MKQIVVGLVVLLLMQVAKGTAAESFAVDVEAQSITIALTQEPPNLNSLRTTDLVSFFVLGHVNEGLVRYDRRGRLVPGVAESWDISPNSMRFTIRADARWNDGSPVLAEDFVFGWQRMNDPSVAAPYASIMYPILNAEKVQKGELPVKALGVRAEGNQLIVDLQTPCGYCLAVMAHVAFFPIKQSFYEAQADKYGAEPEHLLYNGPFVLSDWTHGSRLSMKKNPSYWQREDIHLNEINVGYITADNRTRLNLFRDEQIAVARLGAETVKDAAQSGLRLRTFVSGGMAYLGFNHRPGRLTAKVQVRQAIASTFDSEEFVNKIIAIPGYRSTQTFFPSWIQGVDGKFVDEYPISKQPVSNAKARKLLASVDAGSASLTLLTTTSPTGTKIAEYLQGVLKSELGLDVKVDQQTFKQYLSRRDTGDFDMVVSSWYPDFDDIVTYADLLASYNGNNGGRYNNDQYDAVLKTLQSSLDRGDRMNAAAELQSIIMADVPLIPMAETGSAYLQHAQLKGVVRRVLGADPDYTYARVVEAKTKPESKPKSKPKPKS
jgi:oligopeptide transport system substrate-binding protein